MNPPIVLLTVLSSAFSVRNVLSEYCTEDEAMQSYDLIQERDELQPDGSSCLDYFTLNYDCSDSCLGTYQDLYKELPDCESDLESFGYLNLKELQKTYSDLCNDFYKSRMRGDLRGLPEKKGSNTVPDYEHPHLVDERILQNEAALALSMSSAVDSESNSYDESQSESDDTFEYDEYENRTYDEDRGGLNILILVLPIIAALLVVAGVVFWWLRRRNPAPTAKDEEEGFTLGGAMTMTETVTQPMPPTCTGESSTGSSVYDLWGDRELVDKKLNFADIKDIKVLGSGAYGVVWLVSYYNTYYASKRLARNVVDPVAFDKFVDEVKLVARIEHANIIKCIGVAWTMKSDFQAIFEYMSNGDLRDYLQRSMVPRHWTKEKLCIAIDSAEALVYVQSFERPIVHRDLKSRNVLLSEGMVAKVSDFGSARLMSESNTMTTQAVGSARWLAPEVVAGEYYDHTCDSYSFGAILTELDTHELPLYDATDVRGRKLPDFALMHRVACGEIKPNVSDVCPEAMRDLVDKCLSFEPKERPTAVQISFALRKMLKDGSVLEN